MDITEKIKNICKNQNKVLMFIDMDGTIAEYEFFTKEYKEKNKEGLFKNIRPLTTVIKCLEDIKTIPNIELYILSICMYEYDKGEKLEWLKKHVPFIKKENIKILTMEKGEYNSDTRFSVKAEYIRNLMSSDEYAIFLEDTHDNMKKAKELLGERVTNFHISSFVK